MSFPAVTLANPWETFPFKHLHSFAVFALAGWLVLLCADSSNAVAVDTFYFGIKPHFFYL